jgi:hypothetical protein
MRNFIALGMVAALWYVAAPAQPAFGRLLGASDRLWMLSADHAILRTVGDVRLVDVKTGGVCVLARGMPAAVSTDRQELLIADVDWQKHATRLTVYNLAAWPPQRKIESQLSITVHELAASGMPNLRFIACWSVANDGKSVAGAISAIGPLAMRGGETKIVFSPVPMVSDAVEYVGFYSFAGCADRPYTFAMSGHMTEEAKSLWPKSTLLGKQVPEESITGKKIPWGASGQLVVVNEGTTRWAQTMSYPGASQPLAFSKDGKRLLAKLALDRDGPSPWCLVDVKTGKFRRCEYIPAEMANVPAVSPDLSTGIAREKFALYFVKKGAKPKQLVQYPEAKFEMPPPPPDSATDEERQKWLDQAHENEQRAIDQIPKIAADYWEGRFYVVDGRDLYVITESGDVVSQTPLIDPSPSHSACE